MGTEQSGNSRSVNVKGNSGLPFGGGASGVRGDCPEPAALARGGDEACALPR